MKKSLYTDSQIMASLSRLKLTRRFQSCAVHGMSAEHFISGV